MLNHNALTGDITTKSGETVFKATYRNGAFDFTPQTDYLQHIEPQTFEIFSAGEYWALAMVIENQPR